MGVGQLLTGELAGGTKHRGPPAAWHRGCTLADRAAPGAGTLQRPDGESWRTMPISIATSFLTGFKRETLQCENVE